MIVKDDWYLWDYDRDEVVRGPYQYTETAGAVRTEMDSRINRNLWVVQGVQILQFREDIVTPNGTSVAADSDDQKNTGSKPEAGQ